jgi:hypothetical protein
MWGINFGVTPRTCGSANQHDSVVGHNIMCTAVENVDDMNSSVSWANHVSVGNASDANMDIP